MRGGFAATAIGAWIGIALACGGGETAYVDPDVAAPIPAVMTDAPAPTTPAAAAPAADAPAPPSAAASADAKEAQCSEDWSQCRGNCPDNGDCFMQCPHCSGCVEGEDCDSCPGREEACMSECGANVDTCLHECDRALDSCRG